MLYHIYAVCATVYYMLYHVCCCMLRLTNQDLLCNMEVPKQNKVPDENQGKLISVQHLMVFHCPFITYVYEYIIHMHNYRVCIFCTTCCPLSTILCDVMLVMGCLSIVYITSKPTYTPRKAPLRRTIMFTALSPSSSGTILGCGLRANTRSPMNAGSMPAPAANQTATASPPLVTHRPTSRGEMNAPRPKKK